MRLQPLVSFELSVHSTRHPAAGRGVPIVVHKEHHIFVPELIFGHLLTSSNYDDDERKGGAPARALVSAAS